MKKAKIKAMFLMLVVMMSCVGFAGILDLDADNLRREKILSQNGNTYFVTLKETVFTKEDTYYLYFVENLTEINEIDREINYLSHRISFLNSEIKELNRTINRLEEANKTLSTQLDALTEEKQKLQEELTVLEHRKTELKNQVENNFLIPRIQFLSIIILAVVIFLISLYYEFKPAETGKGKEEKKKEESKEKDANSYYDEDVVVIE